MLIYRLQRRPSRSSLGRIVRPAMDQASTHSLPALVRPLCSARRPHEAARGTSRGGAAVPSHDWRVGGGDDNSGGRDSHRAGGLRWKRRARPAASAGGDIIQNRTIELIYIRWIDFTFPPRRSHHLMSYSLLEGKAKTDKSSVIGPSRRSTRGRAAGR